MQSRLREIYEKEIVPELIKEFGYKNSFAVPKLTKIVLNMGVGEAVSDKKKLEAAVADLTAIAAQKVTEQKGYLLAYHNHWAEYDLVDGVPAMFRILEGAEKLGVEPDICWLHRGGINPADYIRKYKDRIQQIHFKDIVVPDDPDTTTELGRGVVDIKAAFAAAKEIDCQWYILEQDYSADPMQSAKDSIAYLKSLEI